MPPVIIGSGLSASVGLAAEAAYGTFTAPVRWTEFNDESLVLVPKRFEGKGLATGLLVARGSKRVTTSKAGAGDVKFDVPVKGMGLWLAHWLGSTALPVQDAATAAYTQTHVLGSNLGMSLTIQKAVADETATQHAYNFLGCKISNLQLECGIDQPVLATATIRAQAVDETNPLTAAAYQTANPVLHFAQGVISTGAYGAETPVAGVRKVTLAGKRPMKEDRFFFNNAGMPSEPIQNGLFEISGTLDTELIDKTKFVDAFRDDTSTSLLLTFTGSLIASTYYYTLQLHIPQIRFDGETPKVAGPDVIMPAIQFKGFYDDTNPPITAVYTSTDTTL